MSDDILRRLHFRELALRFLDSLNLKPDRAIVIADAICSYDGYIDYGRPVRHFAHEFVRAAERFIEQGNTGGNTPICLWLKEWNEEYGV